MRRRTEKEGRRERKGRIVREVEGESAVRGREEK